MADAYEAGMPGHAPACDVVCGALCECQCHAETASIRAEDARWSDSTRVARALNARADSPSVEQP